jgi:hypothetical protein
VLNIVRAFFPFPFVNYIWVFSSDLQNTFKLLLGLLVLIVTFRNISAISGFTDSLRDREAQQTTEESPCL